MGKKKPSKAKKRVRALKRAEPTAVIADDTDFSQFEPEELKTAPHSFVIHRGKVGRYMKELMKDIRKLMEPFTAANLKMKKGNVLKDYVSIASYFHVSHMCILTRTVLSPYMKICKIPRGPTLTFRIMNYTLARDVLSSLRKQVTAEAHFLHQPLLIMNNFSSESKTLDLISKTFQNMFPSINVNKVRLPEIRRVLLLNYSEEDDTIQIRHYAITYKTTGVSRGIKKVLVSKNGRIPNLSRCTDIADFINRDGDLSESEAEDNTETVGVSQKMGVKFTKGLEEVGIKLVELGPRIQMQLIKVEEGLCEGEVLYHKIVEKTPEEKLAIRQQRNLKKKMKLARKREQEMNVEKKKKTREEHKQKCLQGMGIDPGQAPQEEDDDVDWYRKEVGEDPDEDMFGEKIPSSTPRFNKGQGRPGRKRKFDDSRDRKSDYPSKTSRFSKFDRTSDVSSNTGKVSKFAKVKEKARMLKKLKQKGLLEKGIRRHRDKSGGKSNFSDFKGKKGNFGERREQRGPPRTGPKGRSNHPMNSKGSNNKFSRTRSNNA